jgi:outer membrane immunogenic protein
MRYNLIDWAATALVVATTIVAALPASAQGRPTIWSGAYGGINAGGIGNRFTTENNTNSFYTGSAVGGQLGYNFQNGDWVYGVELDGTAQFGEQKLVTDHTRFFIPHTHELRTSIPFLASARARVGYSFGSALIFVSGGVAAGQYKSSVEYHSVALNVTEFSSSKTHTGAVFGLGAAYKFSTQFSGTIEAQRYQIGESFSKAFDYSTGVYTPVVVRAGLNYHFN